MSDALTFLEAMGGNARLASHAERDGMLEHVDPVVREAILGRDAEALRDALGGRAVMVCSVSLPSEDEPGFDEQPLAPDEEPDESEVRAA